MSETVNLKAELEGLLAPFGFDLKSVAKIVVEPSSITFEILGDAAGIVGAETVIVTFPFKVL